MQLFYQKIDKRSRTEMTNFLLDHYTYDGGYANNIKIYNLINDSYLLDNAYKVISDPWFYEDFQFYVNKFEHNNDNRYCISGGGHNGGYLILYSMKPNGYKYLSKCDNCKKTMQKLTPNKNSTFLNFIECFCLENRRSSIEEIYEKIIFDKKIMKKYIKEILSFTNIEKQIKLVIKSTFNALNWYKVTPSGTINNICPYCKKETMFGIKNPPVKYTFDSPIYLNEYDMDNMDIDELKYYTRLVQCFDKHCDYLTKIFIEYCKDYINEEKEEVTL